MSLFGKSKKVLLCICDGMGYSENTHKNAVKDANTPTLDRIFKEYPFTTITPGGEEVGLPKGVAGNSEVGHLNLGSGRAVRQDLVRINEAIAKDCLKDMEKFQELLTTTIAHSKKLHLLTLLSDGGVHSHIDHLKAVLSILKNYPEIKVYLHAFMDGRDTPRENGIKYIKEIQAISGFTFTSMQGRSIGMDRDRRYEKIQQAYATLTGEGASSTLTAADYIQSQYDQEIYDEFITPVLFDEAGKIESEDSVFFLNFRPDRAKQISLAFCDPKFEFFENKIRPQYFLCMSPYIDEELPSVPILFNREKIAGTLCEYLSILGHKQFKIAETEKYAHVTYFFNGGEEAPFKGEQRVLVNSPKEVATYDQKPEMSAPEVLEKLSKNLCDSDYSFYVVNFANPDMVGHTGNYEAALSAMETIDHCIKKLEEICLKENITMLLTADHGNCDQMEHADGTPHTSHTGAKVPFALIANGSAEAKVHHDKALKDVAPTVLYMLGIEKNELMTGNSIFE